MESPQAGKEIERKISKHSVLLNINGKDYEDEVEPRTLLVYFLRDHIGLTGTHVGCDTTSCGACTVLMDGKAVKSCTVLTVQADGLKIVTIEGVARDSKLHPVQEAFWENHALQCGYCTPGFIMETIWFLQNNPDPTESEIRLGISGNLCMCTGYVNIVRAVSAASKKIKRLQEENLESER